MAGLLAGLGISALSGGLDSAWGALSAKRQYKYNKKLADYAYSKELDMWNYANEYNKPEMQMSRLKEAGLNPNLVYGTGAVANTSAGSLPKYNAPQTDFSRIPNPLQPAMIYGQFQDMQIKNAQINNLAEQNKILREQARIKEAEANVAGDYFKFRKTGLDYKVREQYVDYGWKAGDYDFMKDREGNYGVPSAYQQYQMEKLGYQLDALNTANKLRQANIDKTAEQTKYLQYQNSYYGAHMFGKLFGLAAGAFKNLLGTFTKGGVKAMRQSFNRSTRERDFINWDQSRRQIWNQRRTSEGFYD